MRPAIQVVRRGEQAGEVVEAPRVQEALVHLIQRGLRGYRYPLRLQSPEVYRVDSEQGHDDFVVSPTITHVYYVLAGNGSFDIDGKQFEVAAHDLIEIPPGCCFAYSGKMKLLLIMTPPFKDGELEVVRPNPNVKR